MPSPQQTLAKLGVQWDKKTRRPLVPKDLYGNLLAVRAASRAVQRCRAGLATGSSCSGSCGCSALLPAWPAPAPASNQARLTVAPTPLLPCPRQVGTITIDVGGGDGADPSGGGGEGGGGAKAAPVRLGYDAAAARDWWKNWVFGKTYVERRSVWTMYR